VTDGGVQELIAQALAAGRTALSEIESKRIVARAGVPVAGAEHAHDAGEAVRLATRQGFPAVLKVLSPQVIHKSEVGGVALDLRSPEQVREAFERIRSNLAQRMPGARFDGVSVQPMVAAGVEVLVGCARDPRFGALVTVALGGIFVEILDDSVTRLAPVGHSEARTMIGKLAGAAILNGARGRPACDLEALASLIADVSRLAASNPALRELDLNPVMVYERGLVAVDARVILDPTFREQSAMADPKRSHRMDNLKRAFNPGTVAVIGDKRANSFMWLRSLQGLRGQLYSVQIDPAEIAEIERLGVDNRSSLAEIPGPVDLAISAVPRQAAPRILRDCIAAGVGAISFFTSGFAETGEEPGARLEAELRSLALASDIALVGPNCMGLCNPGIGLLNFPGLAPNGGGEVCFISQSGTHTVNFCLQAAARSVQVNKAASIGNVTVIEAADYLDLMSEDPATRVIGMYIEGMRDGRGLFESLSRAAARHPVVVWKGGVSDPGALATRSHTGSLQTPGAVWDAVVAQSGVVAVASMDAMLDAVELFARGRPALGRRMGLVAMTGGQSVVITDTFAGAGLEIPALSPASYDELKSFFNIIGGSYRNPLDAGGTIGTGLSGDHLERILEILERDPVIDAVVLEIATGLRGMSWASREQDLVGLLDKLAAFNRRSQRPFAVILHPAHIETIVARAKHLARERGLVVFDSFERAAHAFATVSIYWSGRNPGR
jgi:acetate---CoA ligase (ADP-forming) subunit alpha